MATRYEVTIHAKNKRVLKKLCADLLATTDPECHKIAEQIAALMKEERHGTI